MSREYPDRPWVGIGVVANDGIAHDAGLAIGNGILTVENEEQALACADKTRKDKGGEAAKAALAMLALKEQFSIG